jgi:ribosome-interacting GTPase 1
MSTTIQELDDLMERLQKARAYAHSLTVAKVIDPVALQRVHNEISELESDLVDARLRM